MELEMEMEDGGWNELGKLDHEITSIHHGLVSTDVTTSYF